MPSVPDPRTWIDKEKPPYSTITAEVYSTVSFLLERPMVRVRQTAAQSIPNGTATAVVFQTEDVDTYNWHAVNSTQIKPTIPGWFRGWYSIGFSTASGGNYRYGTVLKNGGGGRARRDQKPTIAAQTNRLGGVPFMLSFNGTTDYVELYAYQDSGSAMTLATAVHTNSELFMRWLGPL